MPEKIPRLALVEGDPVLGMDAVVSMKNEWLKIAGSIQWVEMIPPPKKAPNEFLNALDGEVATTDFAGEHKVVFLRGLLGTKVFMEGLSKVVTGVAPGNTLLVFDEDGIIKSDTKGKQSGWGILKEKFIKHGMATCTQPPFKEIGEIPWGKRFGNDHVKAVVSETARLGKKMSPQVARDVFLELVMPDWSYILKEIEKLAELVPGETITAKDVYSIVFPWSQEHAIFEFCVAFNDGNFSEIMRCYDNLTSCKIPPEMIYSYCTKLLRWQMIASHLASYGQSLPSSLDAIGALMNKEAALVKTAKIKSIKPHLFKEQKPGSENDEKDGITPFTSKAVSNFIKNVFTRRVPLREDKLGTLPFMQAAMKRYLTMVDCMVEFRFCGDRSRARDLFKFAMYKVCWRG